MKKQLLETREKEMDKNKYAKVERSWTLEDIICLILAIQHFWLLLPKNSWKMKLSEKKHLHDKNIIAIFVMILRRKPPFNNGGWTFSTILKERESIIFVKRGEPQKEFFLFCQLKIPFRVSEKDISFRLF